jgi:hypothetical protein
LTGKFPIRDKQQERKDSIMAMSNEEAVALVNSTNETLVKVSNETDALLREIQRLNDALASAGGQGGTITAELEAAIKAVDTRAKSIDQLVADVPQPEGAKKK